MLAEEVDRVSDFWENRVEQLRASREDLDAKMLAYVSTVENFYDGLWLNRAFGTLEKPHWNLKCLGAGRMDDPAAVTCPEHEEELKVSVSNFHNGTQIIQNKIVLLILQTIIPIISQIRSRLI